MYNKDDQIKKEYQAILNNLLDVSPNDSAVFTNLNSKFNFDCLQYFDEDLYNKIIYQNDFEIPLLEKYSQKMIEQIKLIETPEQLIEYLLNNNFELSDNRQGQIEKHFFVQKERIISELKAKFQKQITDWKLFANRAVEIYEQSSTWPLHLGFVFVKVSIEGKPIYSPLFLKEVDLVFKNGRAYLKSSSGIKLNEKLLFILQQAKFDLTIHSDISEWTISNLIDYLNVEWKDLYNFNIKLVDYCQKLKPETIVNRDLEFSSGIVLGLYQPSGGYVRNRMLDIINKGELESILEVEFNKNKYVERIDKVLFNPESEIFKITPTNYSQDRAIISAMNQNTIIWGPPGTGKSQTIVNILTNILVYQKTALVCSEKKAALDVIKDRMQGLSDFCLFLVLSRNIKRKSFYEPIKKYLNYLQNFDLNNKILPTPTTIITKQEIDFVEQLAQFQNDPKFDYYAYLIAKLDNKFSKIDQELWDYLIQIRDYKWIFANNFAVKNEKAYISALLKENKVKFKIFNKLNRSIKKHGATAYNKLKDLNWDINEVLEIMHEAESDDLQKIQQLISILPINDSKEISEEDKLKHFIAWRINQKIEKLSPELQEMLRHFTIAANTGKIEPFKFVKQFAPIIKVLYPIIIANPETDLSPWEKQEFDYVILDESSQIFIEKGLPLLYLGKRKILAGDDQQMKPSNWFGIRYTDEDTIYGTVESLLDYAKSLGVHTILLDKNYRSNYAALMTFSSKNFYNSSLDVIDAFKINKNEPIEVYDINGVWENNTNLSEVKLAIEQLQLNLSIYDKIILLCFNKKQQEYIQNEILNNHPDLEKALLNNNLLIRNIENIQGDEADLVIATIGYDANATIHATYVGRPGGRNALNVAISRAKDKLIVIKSLKSSDIQLNSFENEDVLTFKKWLEFLELSPEERKAYITTEKAEKSLDLEQKSNFYNDVKEHLTIELAKYPHLKLVENQTIGTINISFAIMNQDNLEIGFVIDDLNYQNAGDYLKFNDIVKFIKAKKYRIYNLNRIAWEKEKDAIFEFIKNLDTEIDNYISDETIELIYQNQESEKTLEIDYVNYPQLNALESLNKNSDANEEVKKSEIVKL
ncbi:DEAD/DEAH box helicase [Mycoplasmopsis iners]|uniref:DEAD/DEAH box helicase n=1 Tax=Mycoplasmopsis iners TaxID=76630 RepID=UPI00068D01B5|nr:DEAD/DEAH box helicase [Mycoplasmopsis iners]